MTSSFVGKSKPRLLGIFVGIDTVVIVTIVFSLLSLVLFADLIESGNDDVLMTSTGPLVYALAVVFAAMVLGVFLCSRIVGAASFVDAVAIGSLYAGFTYLLSQSPSNLDNPYPAWFVVSRYVILLPAAAIGYLASKRFAEGN